MLINNRIILSKNGVLKDLSLKLGNYISGSEVIDIVAADDVLYIGSDLPFNHRFFDVGVANASASIASVEYYSNNVSGWIPVVNLLDDTQATAGTTLGKSGVISFTSDREYLWSRQDTKNGVNGTFIEELKTVTIYDLFWCRVKFSADLDGTTALKYIGHKFCEDEDLKKFYPDLVKAEVYEQFETGKTNWNEQIIAASEIIVRDLKNRGIVKSANQILAPELFNEACIHALAEIIYRGFGVDYRQAAQDAHGDYKQAISISLPMVDKDGDAIASPFEKAFTTGTLCR